MKRMLTLAAVLPIALSASFVSLTASPAQAGDDRVCRGSIGARYVDGNVIVPRGAVCALNGTRVDGDVKVYRNARLVASGVKVGGNIQAGNAKRVVVRMRDGVRSRVDGNIQLKSGTYGGIVAGARVNGDIQLFSNRGRFTVRGNVVDGNLQCKSNSPRPIGGNNRVEGNKENQCRGL
ncbi:MULTISPECIES: hypothetical protein [unclassified Nocardioides]|uniref:hypothetical protein n=1 Tax=unclassified Nocardioides TaxID=2615069 RepID=UPI0006F4B2B6|nr:MULTISPECIES: hypothetical protein [unclassified Nocardioides]KQY64718.1 hypothetical protein ASD30_07435 [Nocardioides sp. Root140]KQZ67302.1 hypothetical protein ASD66_20270 [Nocardioides sp. Root151]KRF12620.1 hypothetical protein ASH02_13790 [Nocardioides sp. Soil796]